MLDRDSEYFYALQTQTGWGRTLAGFVEWCEAQPGWITLDVGCGPGLLPALLEKKGCKTAGVDLDEGMFRPRPIHKAVAAADVFALPFAAQTFDLITASNLLFLLDQPTLALVEMKRLVKHGGKVALLNPTEILNVEAAEYFAGQRGLEGMARDTFVNWARRAEANHRWTEDEIRALYSSAGLKYMAGIIKVGPGFARFSWGTT